MKKIILFLMFIISFGFSAIDECKTDVYYANGILTTRYQAKKNAEKILEPALRNDIYSNDEDEMYKHIGEVGYSYNQTNGMILDGLETYMQKLDMQLYFDGWEASKGYITSHFEDYQEHYTRYVSRIKEGHKVLVVAHSQGNLFTNEIYKRLGSQSKDGWLQEYFGVVSVASPMNADISEDTERITWDNDPVGRWVAHMGSPTADEVPDPIRRIDWKYEPCLMGEENCTMLIPEPYAKKSDLGRVIGGKYTAEELDASIFGYDLGKIDPASNVHAFTYYMGEPLAEDIVLEKGLFWFPDKMGRRKFHDPFNQNNTLQTDIAKAKIMSAIDKQLQNLEKAPSQWETDQSFDQNTKDYKITVKHRKDSSIKVSARVYPFNTEGKLYQVNGKWVKASCGGEHILEEWPDQKEDEYWMIDNPQEEKIIGRHALKLIARGGCGYYAFNEYTPSSAFSPNNGHRFISCDTELWGGDPIYFHEMISGPISINYDNMDDYRNDGYIFAMQQLEELAPIADAYIQNVTAYFIEKYPTSIIEITKVQHPYTRTQYSQNIYECSVYATDMYSQGCMVGIGLKVWN